MPEENQPVPAREIFAPQPKSPGLVNGITTAQSNGQPNVAPSIRTPDHGVARALAVRLMISALLFVVLALLAIGCMVLAHVGTNKALTVGVLGAFLAVAALQSFLPITSGRPVVASGSPAPAGSHTLSGDLLMLLRWLAGLFIVIGCGWLCLGLAAYLFWDSTTSAAFQTALFVAAVLSFVAFYLLERDWWLSRFMGLHIHPNSSPIVAAVWLWLFGVAGLLLRSTTRADAATAEATREKPEAQQAPSDSVREVIETVVFVVVLVLLLKSFVAEAFVIPTGSMAETLYGYQKVITCPKCTFVFPVNVSQQVDPTEGRPTDVTGCTCPNCRYHIDFKLETSPGWVNPEWGSGDRVLVGKYFYELVDRPERLEVVVFKYPGGNDWPVSGPEKYYVPLNYIKRLIGKPRETIAIYKGKIYILSPELSPHYNDWEEAQHDPEKMARLWQTTNQHVNDQAALDLFNAGKFTKLRKPPDTMLAVARNVYDNNHQDKTQPQRWTGGGWVADNKFGFSHAAGAGNTEWLHYRHLVGREHPDKKTLITDFMGYNTYEPHPKPGENWVGDLLIECEATLDKTEGQFVLELSKSHHRYQARWNLANGDCDLYQLDTDSGKENKLGSAKTPVSVQGRTYRLRFADVDGKLTVWVDRSMPFGEDGVPYETGFNRNSGPTEKNDLEPASIGVQGGAVQVHKLRLLRDTYYTTGNTEKPTINQPGYSDYDIDFGNPETWAKMDSLDKQKVRTMYVQPGHYLCLGDNSPESSDGRSWGSVPERLLLGRAMLVYYPFGRAGKIR